MTSTTNTFHYIARPADRLSGLNEAAPAPRVVLSFGLGLDSTSLLMRWLADPASRDFDLSELAVVTAMTGHVLYPVRISCDTRLSH